MIKLKPKTFAELLASSRGKQVQSAPKTPPAKLKLNFKSATPSAIEPKANTRDVLFGTGITKKVAVAATKTREKLDVVSIAKETVAKELHLDDVNTELDEQPPILSLDVPSDIEYDKSQLAALSGLEHQKYGVLIGAAGTGKTTVTKELVRRIEKSTPQININDARVEGQKSDKVEYTVAIAFAAFTGRAVQQMKRALPHTYHKNASTIHSLLGYAPTREPFFDEDTQEYREKLVFRPTFDASHKLPYKVIIIDEAGMVPIQLWNELVAACKPDVRIMLIGDINQLPPVQGRSVLGFAMIKWPTFALETIHRQAADNPIIANAHNILQGKFPLNNKESFIIQAIDEGSIKTANYTIGVIQHLHKKGLFDPFVDGLIVPQNKDTLGQLHLNEILVKYFNPQKKNEDGAILNKRHIIVAGREKVTYATGDKVMLLKNDNIRGLTNGMTGVIVDIKINGAYGGSAFSGHATLDMGDGLDLSDMATAVEAEEENAKAESEEAKQQASHVVTVRFGSVDDGQEVPFASAGQVNCLTHAYAFTCHKSQGGEYPTVVILVHSANSIMLSREWLYTAVTRAQKRVIIVCNNRGLMQAIKNQRIKGKTVQEKAQQFLALQDKNDTSMPDLAEPEAI